MVSSLAAVERCWCSRDCRNLHSSQTAELDRRVPKVTAGEERRGGGRGGHGEEYIRLFRFARGAAPPLSFLLRCLFSPADFPILLLYLKNLNAAL